MYDGGHIVDRNVGIVEILEQQTLVVLQRLGFGEINGGHAQDVADAGDPTRKEQDSGFLR